jgi:hypothetical protein
MLVKEPIAVGGFGGKVSWSQVQKFPNNTELFYKTELLMMQKLAGFAIIGKLLNKQYRIYIRHTELYMTEAYQRIKYIIAEADTLEEICLDWEIISNNIVPIFQECILSTRRITFKDLALLCETNRDTAHSFDEYDKFELPQVGIRFNHQKIINPLVKHNDNGFLIHFSDVMPFFDIAIVPCYETTLSDMLQFEINLLNTEYKDVDIYHYQTTHLSYEIIHFGYEIHQDNNILKYWCMMMIKHGFYYKFMIYGYKQLFHMRYFNDVIMSLNFSNPKLKIHCSNGIMFTYSKDLIVEVKTDPIVSICVKLENTEVWVGRITIQDTQDNLTYLFKGIKDQKLYEFDSKAIQFQNQKCFLYEHILSDKKHVCCMLVTGGKYYNMEVQTTILNQDSLKSLQSVFPTFQILQ